MVRVFGLERSGTNLLEWVIVNHFKSDYDRIMVTQEEKGMRYYKKQQLLKHTLPTDDYEEKNIVIYKDYNSWRKSWYAKYKKKGRWVLGGNVGCNLSVYKNYLERAKKIGALLISYEDFVNDYENQMYRIADYLGVELKEIKSLPNSKMGTNMKPCE